MKKFLSNIILTFSVTIILSIIITCIEMIILVDILGVKNNISLLYVMFINTLIILNIMTIALFLAIKYIEIVIKILNGNHNKKFNFFSQTHWFIKNNMLYYIYNKEWFYSLFPP